MSFSTDLYVGERTIGNGVVTDPPRGGNSGEVIFGQLHGRFYETNLRGRLYMGGMTITSISNATFNLTTTGVTATPIIGLWNPATSTVDLVVLQAYLGISITNATNTGPGPFVWMYGTGNSVISTGSTGLNGRTMLASSTGKFYPGTALTGMTSTLAILRGSGLHGGSSANFSFVGTAVGQATVGVAAYELIDGGIIVPPGGVLSLQSAATGVAHSAVSGIMWEEVPRP